MARIGNFIRKCLHNPHVLHLLGHAVSVLIAVSILKLFPQLAACYIAVGLLTALVFHYLMRPSRLQRVLITLSWPAYVITLSVLYCRHGRGRASLRRFANARKFRSVVHFY
jgi:hypothetical protein